MCRRSPVHRIRPAGIASRLVARRRRRHRELHDHDAVRPKPPNDDVNFRELSPQLHGRCARRCRTRRRSSRHRHRRHRRRHLRPAKSRRLQRAGSPSELIDAGDVIGHRTGGRRARHAGRRRAGAVGPDVAGRRAAAARRQRDALAHDRRRLLRRDRAHRRRGRRCRPVDGDARGIAWPERCSRSANRSCCPRRRRSPCSIVLGRGSRSRRRKWGCSCTKT